MDSQFPDVSFVMPVLNGGRRLGEALETIRAQEYPAQIEIIVADGGSTDDTLAVARRYGCRTTANPLVVAESGKTAGIAEASHDIICLLDDDNRLPTPDWLVRMVTPLVRDPTIVGCLSAWYTYDRADPAPDRYAALFGINDPLSYYLGSRDRLKATETAWGLGGTVAEEDGYFKVGFAPTHRITLGSQGFVVRKSAVFETDWQPYFYHIEACLSLIRSGHNQFAMVKVPVTHMHSASSKAFLGKLSRNVEIYLSHRNTRGPSWFGGRRPEILWALFRMVTVVHPLSEAIKGYSKKRDLAWFLHPVFSALAPFAYARGVFRYMLRGRPKAASEDT